jgi:hypothetical protein
LTERAAADWIHIDTKTRERKIMEWTLTTEVGKNTRRYDNDWLTVGAMLMIFFFHCARFFNFEEWRIK